MSSCSLLPALALGMALLGLSPLLSATTLAVGPGGEALQAAVDRARPGDRLRLAAGRYRVHLRITQPLTLVGVADTRLDGGGRGDVVRIQAPGVTLRGPSILASGHDLTSMDAGVFVDRSAAHVLVEQNNLDGNGFGIWLDGCPAPRVIGNLSTAPRDCAPRTGATASTSTTSTRA